MFSQLSPAMKKSFPIQNLSEDKDYTASLREQYSIQGIIGRSKALADVLKTALMIAPLDINILLTGASGTGKTQFAEMIHQNSQRKNNAFVSLNCAALPEALIENELFGSVQGGHSSATKPVLGKVSAAKGGTLFLDEIGELPVTVQAKLLQVLQSGHYFPLGSSEQLTADVRVITATNINLQKAIRQKMFREDLYYRINVFSIHMPALSGRKSDIYELALFFCQISCKKHGFPPMRITGPVLKILYNKAWNGNVRELKHAVETAAIRAVLDNETEIKPCHLVPEPSIPDSDVQHKSDFKEATRSFQKNYLKKNLNARNWNISQTARELSLSRSQLNNLINTFELKRECLP